MIKTVAHSKYLRGVSGAVHNTVTGRRVGAPQVIRPPGRLSTPQRRIGASIGRATRKTAVLTRPVRQAMTSTQTKAVGTVIPERGPGKGPRVKTGKTPRVAPQRAQRPVRAAQAPPRSKGRQQQSPYGAPEMPDFFQGVQPIPSYEQIAGNSGSDISHYLSMVSGTSTGSSIGGTGVSSYQVGNTSTAPTAPSLAPTSPVTNNVNQLAQGITGALGGTANQGTSDTTAFANALSSSIPSQIPTPGYSAAATGGGGGGGGGYSYGGGGSSRSSGNPYTAAATLQKMQHAEDMFGPKMMAQYLKNQGYSINNAADYQKAWMESALFGPKYHYAQSKATGQDLRNYATNLSTNIVKKLAGYKVAGAALSNQSKQSSITGSNARTAATIQSAGNQNTLSQARLQKIYADIAKGNKTKPAGQKINVSLSRQVGFPVSTDGTRIQTSPQVAAAFKTPGARGGAKPNLFGLTPASYAKATATAQEGAYTMYNGHDPTLGVKATKRSYKQAIIAIMGHGIPQGVATRAVNKYYKPGERGRPYGSRPNAPANKKLSGG